MRVIFDQATPVPIVRISRATSSVPRRSKGWEKLANGDLLTVAEQDHFDVLLTTDRNMRYQQNFVGRKIAVVVLGRQQWPQLRPHIQRVVEAVNAATPGSYVEVDIPDAP